MKLPTILASVSLLVAIVSMAPVALAEEDDREVVVDYLTTNGVIVHQVGVGPHIGGASSIDIEDGETSLSVVVEDDLGDAASIVAFYDADDNLIYGHGFCNELDDHTIPEDAAFAAVLVGADVYMQNAWGFSCNSDATPLAGTITLTFA